MAVTVESVEDLTADQVFAEYIACISDMLSHARKLFAATVSARTDMVTVGLVAAILHRMVECAESILILAGQERARDMAVLLLNLMELRVDLQYIARSPEREAVWLSHSNEWRKPWALAAQLKEICSRPEDRQGQTDWYHTLSTIKHGSPAKISWLEKFVKTPAASGGVAFSITRDASKVLFDKQNLGHMMGT